MLTLQLPQLAHPLSEPWQGRQIKKQRPTTPAPIRQHSAARRSNEPASAACNYFCPNTPSSSVRLSSPSPSASASATISSAWLSVIGSPYSCMARTSSSLLIFPDLSLSNACDHDSSSASSGARVAAQRAYLIESFISIPVLSGDAFDDFKVSSLH